jgi:DNA-directed RNA polymerase sigma subunit (sigma70/sigma32)
MNLILTNEAVEWFFSRPYCPFEDVDKARLICDMRLNGVTLRDIGNQVGLSKDRVRQYIYRVQKTYEKIKKKEGKI